jgi:hypothetical protein
METVEAVDKMLDVFRDVPKENPAVEGGGQGKADHGDGEDEGVDPKQRPLDLARS